MIFYELIIITFKFIHSIEFSGLREEIAYYSAISCRSSLLPRGQVLSRVHKQSIW